MFSENSDPKPISIIITTLAAAAYRGENDLEGAMQGILKGMGALVRETTPRVANPVNPEEDFADKWPTPEGLKLGLEENFWAWLKRARSDFDALRASDNPEYLVEQAGQNFGAALNLRDLSSKLKMTTAQGPAVLTGLAAREPSGPVDLRGGGRNG